ncbi:MAG: ABC transporter permease, partial [Spirochaeta sp.]|nr:ABC transporter permease [Spirochaeta sp.]
MQQFIIRRILVAFVVLFGVSTFVFFMVHLIPGDPATVMLGVRATPSRVAAIRENMGLDEPLVVQYGNFLLNVVQGDFGRSFRTNRPVVYEIQVRMWPT